MARRFFDHIELWLSGAGLAVVWVVTLFAPGLHLWKVAALAALAVSVVHGVIFYAVRRRQRRVRHEAIHEIREMLTDEVKNQLAVLTAALPDAARMEYAGQLDDLNTSIETIGEAMDSISEEKLTAWKRTYANAAEHYRMAA